MSDLAERLLAAIEETERIARGDLLTSADPEPPPGTTVELFDGEELWTRHADMWPGSWLRHGSEETGDPETWTKVAGNYGPARVIRLDRDTVLRRCAADRKIVELHKPDDFTGRECTSCWVEDPDGASPHGMTMESEAWPCPTLLALADGYGIEVGE